jgi:hypothetical protein
MSRMLSRSHCLITHKIPWIGILPMSRRDISVSVASCFPAPRNRALPETQEARCMHADDDARSNIRVTVGDRQIGTACASAERAASSVYIFVLLHLYSKPTCECAPGCFLAAPATHQKQVLTRGQQTASMTLINNSLCAPGHNRAVVT